MNANLYTILSASIEFCHQFEKKYYTFLKQAGFKQRMRTSRMELAEILAVQIYFHFSGYSNLKTYYKYYGLKEIKSCIQLDKYSQFNQLSNETPFLLDLFLNHALITPLNITLSTLHVCHFAIKKGRILRKYFLRKEAQDTQLFMVCFLDSSSILS